MLQAPTGDRKTKAEASSKTAEYLPEYEPSSQSIGGIGRSGQSQPLQQRENLAALQKVYGNQAVLRMKGRSTAANPEQGGVLQRKCACGNSAGSSGSCAECQSKQEGILQTKLQIGEPGDRYEQEADRIADRVMGMPEPTIQHSGKESVVQRKVIANQVAPSNSNQDSRQVPSIVHEVLKSSDQPLDLNTRNFMESRFSHDFTQVRVHADAKAAESARAVNAVAYTVGKHVVFRGGAFAPGTTKGKRLLAHELVHVIQQEKGQTLVPGVANTRGYEADGDSGQQQPEGSTVTAQLLQRDSDGGTDASPSSEQLDDKPKKVCGPEITKQLKDAQLKTRKQFAGWKNPRKESACQDLVSIVWGEIAWDIIQLNESDWILAKYGPVCASEGPSPSCIKSIKVDGNCFYAGSVNYAHFGNMFDLCQGYYASADPLNKQFSETEMLKWINLYKGPGIFPASANFKSSVDWALAGFHNWPHGALTPLGDRSNCSPTCPLPYTWGDFDVNWSGETF